MPRDLTRPRVPRYRAPIISVGNTWQSTARRVLAVVVLATFGGVALLSMLAWWARAVA